jgi:hypothetical protein
MDYPLASNPVVESFADKPANNSTDITNCNRPDDVMKYLSAKMELLRSVTQNLCLMPPILLNLAAIDTEV